MPSKRLYFVAFTAVTINIEYDRSNQLQKLTKASRFRGHHQATRSLPKLRIPNLFVLIKYFIMKIFTFICFNTIISQYYINNRNTDSWYMKRTDLISNFEIMAKLNVSFLLYLKIPSRAGLTRSKVRHCLYDSFLV